VKNTIYDKISETIVNRKDSTVKNAVFEFNKSEFENKSSKECVL
jgi:hypothetical protein